MENELRVVFQKQISTLSKARKATEEGPKTEDIPGFVLSNFWLHYTLGVNSLSSAVTRLALLLTEPPLPELSIVKDCVMEIEAAYMSMVNAYISLPKSGGTQLCKALGNATQAILSPLHTYFAKIHREPSDATQAEVVGVIWRSCELVSGLPKDNRAAVIRLLETEKDLIKDALDELEEEVRAQRGALKSAVVVSENRGWAEEEVELVVAGTRLVWSVHLGLVRLVSSLTQAPLQPSPHALDLLASAAVLLSPSLDDFISSLYPPIDLEPLTDQVEQVVNTVNTVLDLLAKFKLVKPSDEGWTKELRTKLEENESDLKRLVASRQILAIDSLSIQ